MKLRDVLAAQGSALTLPEVDIQDLCSDSRRLTPQSLWLAQRGLNHHALDYPPAVQPAAIVYEPPYASPPPEALPLPNLSALAGEIAHRFHGEISKKIPVIGVTGTDGKSSLVHLLAQIQPLQAAMLGTIGYGRLDALRESSHTTPEALRLHALLAEFVAAGAKTVAMEVSSHALRQHRVAGIDFAVAVFSNLSHDHLDYHRDLEDYFQSKALLFRQARQAVINIDDAHGRRLLAEGHIHVPAITVSAAGQDYANPRHVYAEAIEARPQGLRFTLVLREGERRQRATVESALLARFNVANLLNVAAVLWALNHDLDAMLPWLQSLRAVRGRADALPLANGAQAIIDYAHTPAALENILQGIRPHVRGQLYCVFGCGGDRDRSKRPKMGQAAQRHADAVVLTDDNPRREDPAQILQDIQLPEAMMIQPRAAAIEWVLRRLQPGDAVVIAGKGHEDYQIIGEEKQHYSDFEVVKRFQEAP